MMKFLEDEAISAERDQGRASARAASPARSSRSSCGASFKNKGVQPLLDAVIDYLPSPLDVAAIRGIDLKTDEEVERPADAKAPFAALAFKVMTDPYVGKLTYFRVYSGHAWTRARTCSNSTKGHKERIGRLLRMHANHREDIDTAYAGDIVAAVGLKNTTTGDTLCDRGRPGAPRVDGLPGPGHRHRHRAEDEGRPGEARPGARASSPRRTRRSACAPTRRPARRSSPAWASCTSRSSSTGCCASSRSRPTSASRRSRTARRSSKAVTEVETKFVRQTGGRGPVRPRRASN